MYSIEVNQTPLYVVKSGSLESYGLKPDLDLEKDSERIG